VARPIRARVQTDGLSSGDGGSEGTREEAMTVHDDSLYGERWNPHSRVMFIVYPKKKTPICSNIVGQCACGVFHKVVQ
jgi:hypothetical protein